METSMDSSHDPILGVHARALGIWSRRNEVLAANIANADTPHYKARDIDFSAALGEARASALRVATTHAGHLNAGGGRGADAPLLYRIPHQPALDGNSVEADVEQANFAKNALHYQASLMFIGGKLRTMRAAIAGGHQ